MTAGQKQPSLRDDHRYAYYKGHGLSIPVFIVEQPSPKSVKVLRTDGITIFEGTEFYPRVSSLELAHPPHERDVLEARVNKAWDQVEKSRDAYNKAVRELDSFLDPLRR